MPKKVSKKAGYTQAQKLAYYKAKAARNYAGKGAYKPAPKSRAAGASIGRSIGGAASFLPGGSVLAPAASWLGDKIGGYLGNKLGSYFGWGAYSVNRNSLTVPEGNSPASMHTSGMTTRISHREYIGDILSSGTAGAFKLESYQMQPGSATMFPWLSDLAINYQKYRMLGAIIEFKSGSGDAITGTNTALGEVIISTNYNCADPNFTSRNQMENTQYCSSAKPSVSFVHIIECDPAMQAQEALYTSQSTIPISGLNPNDINWCNVQVATIGCQGTNVNLGSLYITYEIELIQPIEYSSIRRPLTDLFEGTTGWSAAAPWAGSVADGGNSLGGTLVSAGTTYYAFPNSVKDGLFQFTCYWRGSVSTIFVAPILTYTNCAASTILIVDSSSQMAAPGGSTSTQAILVQFVRVTGQGAVVTFGGAGTLPTTPVQSALMVAAIDGSFMSAAPRVPKSLYALPPPAKPTVMTPEPHKQIHRESTTIRDEYHEALSNCSDVGDSEVIERLKRKLAELENKSPALAYQVDRLNRQ